MYFSILHFFRECYESKRDFKGLLQLAPLGINRGGANVSGVAPGAGNSTAGKAARVPLTGYGGLGTPLTPQSFMAFDSCFNHRRMKESLLIDIFAHRVS